MESAQYQYSLGAIGDNSFQINKCARFFKTLIHMAANKPGAYTVKLAIRDILSGTMSPETFAVKLQEGLQSEAQKNLLPFLRSHLMTLRGALQNENIPTRYTEVAALKNLMKSEGLEIMTGQSSNLPHPATVYPQTQSTICATNSRSPGDHLAMVSAVHQHKTKIFTSENFASTRFGSYKQRPDYEKMNTLINKIKNK